MKNILLNILIYIFNLIIKPVTYKLNIQFYNIYSKEVLKLIVTTTNTLSFLNIFNLILICLKNKMFKDVEDTPTGKTVLNLNNELENISSNYKKSLVGFKLEFISYMLTLSIIFKFISTFWYLILILPLRTLINFIFLLFVGLDLNYFIDIWNDLIYPYFITSIDYYKNLFNEFKNNLQNVINTSKGNKTIEQIEKTKKVWSEEDIKLMKGMKEDYQQVNDAVNNLNNNSINPGWYVLGACGVLFIGIGIYIYFVVDRSIDAEVNSILGSITDFTKDKGKDILPDSSNITGVVQNLNNPQPSTSTAPGTIGNPFTGVDFKSECSSTPTTGDNTLISNNIVSTTNVVVNDPSALSKLVGNGKNVAGKVGTIVQEGTSKLNDQGRNIFTNISEHVSNVHNKAATFHNPQARPVIDTTSNIMSFKETSNFSIPVTAKTPETPLKNIFDSVITDLKPIDRSIDITGNEYNEALELFFQPSQTSSAQPAITNFNIPNPIIKHSLDNIKAFEENLIKPIVNSVGNDFGSGTLTPTTSPIINNSSSQISSRINMFSNDYPRLGLKFNANIPSPIEKFYSSNSNSTSNILLNTSSEGKFAAHLNDKFDGVKPNVIPELIKLPETPLNSEFLSSSINESTKSELTWPNSNKPTGNN